MGGYQKIVPKITLRRRWMNTELVSREGDNLEGVNTSVRVQLKYFFGGGGGKGGDTFKTPPVQTISAFTHPF